MNFYRKKDAELAPLSTDFFTYINTNFASLDLVQAQATAYGVLNTDFHTKFQTALNPVTRTAAAITARNAARKQLVQAAKGLAEFIIANPNVSNDVLQELGLDPRRERVPAPVPSTSPLISIKTVVKNVVTVGFKRTGTDKPRGKPDGVDTISVWTHVGTSAPIDSSDWVFQGSTGKNYQEIPFDNTLPPGTQVWITAFYVNTRKETGPAATPITTNLQGGTVEFAQAA